MGAIAAGQVVILPFPFSDLTERKYRPALVLAVAGRGDWIVCVRRMSDRSVKRFAVLRTTLETQLADGEKLGAVIREKLIREKLDG
ncbi:hypothetical protein [Halochromatium glycolicum]|uniref:hypothetical protein n=1 Tax=Halochromatium glycolicum TaxID=85075 RepID=UPI001F5BEBAC|nr:hypothetical protein [Halochromatium glycolicum]